MLSLVSRAARTNAPIPVPPWLNASGAARSAGFAHVVAACLALAGLPSQTQAQTQLPGEAPVRWKPLEVTPGTKVGFTLLDPAMTGLTFTNALEESRQLTQHLLLGGSGVTAGDFDGDGSTDVFFAGLGGQSSLWRNLGAFRFTNVTAQVFGTPSPLATLDATGCAAADLNGDGFPDLVINSHGQGTHVFLSRGSSRLQALPPLNVGRGGRSIAIADVDGDGWLDLYLVNHRVVASPDLSAVRATFRTLDGRAEVATVDGRPTTAADLTNRFAVNARGVLEELGEPDALYLNQQGTSFREVPWTDGAWLDAEGKPLRSTPRDWGLSAQFRDLQGDGRPELYVGNEFQSPDRFWLNESRPGVVRFRAARAGTLRHTSWSSAGIDFADVNRDGVDDLFVVDRLSLDPAQRLVQSGEAELASAEALDPQSTPQYEVNTLQVGRGDGTFAEMAAFAGVQASGWSWTPAFLDVDLDGWEDLLVTTGCWRSTRDPDLAAEMRRLRQTRRVSEPDLLEFRRRQPRIESPQAAFRNERGRFRECATDWGFDARGVGQGLCLVDLDSDGDADVVINRLNGPAWIFRNEGTRPRLQVRLMGAAGNRSGIGARITLTPSEGSAVPAQTQEVIAGGRYLSGDAAPRTFALVGEGPWKLRVRWPDGRFQEAAVTTTNQSCEFHSLGATSAPVMVRAAGTPWFEDISDRLGHVHRSEVFDEFPRQPLLPRRLGTEGPAAAWADVDGDGREELVLPGGNQGRMEVFKVLPGPRFEQIHQIASLRAQPMAVPWNGGLLISESVYADGAARGSSLVAWPGGQPALAAEAAAVGALAMADLENDGRLEVFLGGRVIPGAWPRDPGSRVLTVTPQGFEVRQVFTNLGMVRSAVFADFDQDGDSDLAVAPEWGEPRFLRNEGGQLAPWSPGFLVEGQLADAGALSGLWNSVNVGDFDGDGRLDLVLGNCGENTAWQVFGLPWIACHTDLDGDGTEDILTGFADPSLSTSAASPLSGFRPMHGLGALAASVPSLRQNHRSHQAFANATLGQILGQEGSRIPRLTVRWTASCLLLQRPGSWEVRRLADPAQASPVHGIAVTDWDGDGMEDLFLSQNDFGPNHGLTRDDAGLGLLLRGRGDGSFDALSPETSGIRMEGEGRAATVADIDQDGRPDLVVTQRGSQTRVFRNLRAQPGLRVRLESGAGNPLGAGATVRWTVNGKAVPARAWTYGAGQGASDAAVRVMARPGSKPGILTVSWPDGGQSSIPVGADIPGVWVRRDGQVTETCP
jgi:enediyne biosynthesis protein E4